MKPKLFNTKDPVASYDSFAAYRSAVDYFIEDGVCANEEDAAKHEDFEWRVGEYDGMNWASMEEKVETLCERYFKQGAGLICPSFGWRKAAGASDFHSNAFEAYQKAYIGDCSIKVYLKKNPILGVYLEVVVSHHDSPAGDHFFLVRKKYYTDFVQSHLGLKAA